MQPPAVLIKVCVLQSLTLASVWPACLDIPVSQFSQGNGLG